MKQISVKLETGSKRMCPFLTGFWLLKTFLNVKVYHRCGRKTESTPANFFILRLCDEKERCCSLLIRSPNEWTPWHFLKNDLSEPEGKWFSAVQVAVWAGLKFLFAVFQVIGVFKVWLIRKNDFSEQNLEQVWFSYINKKCSAFLIGSFL